MSAHPFHLQLQHSSMQFSDTPAAQLADAEKVFTVGSDVITGTEAGAEAFLRILRAAARMHGYTFHASGRGEWIAIRDGLGVVRREGMIPVLKGQRGPARLGGHAPRGIFWTEIEIPHVGLVTSSTGHYLTKGRTLMTFRGRENRRYIEALGAFALEHGRGSRLVFFGADTNMNDRTAQVVGPLLTTAWDELGLHPSTHGPHGSPLDVIASYNHDGRVRCVHAEVLDRLHLNTDHQTIVATYAIRPLTTKE